MNNNLIQEIKNIAQLNQLNIDFNFSNENFIREFQEKVDWGWISTYQKLSEYFIKEFQDKVDWDWISGYQKLSENFIREFQEKVDWVWISQCQKLSEEFIREFQDKVYWNLISEYQKLSEDFIYEFRNKINSAAIIKNKKIKFSHRFLVNLYIDKEYELFDLLKQKPGNIMVCKTIEQKIPRLMALE